MARICRPDLILVDIQLPDIDGLEVLRRRPCRDEEGADHSDDRARHARRSGAFRHCRLRWLHPETYLDPSVSRRNQTPLDPSCRWTSRAMSVSESTVDALRFLRNDRWSALMTRRLWTASSGGRRNIVRDAVTSQKCSPCKELGSGMCTSLGSSLS